MDSDKVNLIVTGMTCTNCAMTVQKTLEKKGAEDIQVNYLTGDVSFSEPSNVQIKEVVNAINQLGYSVQSNIIKL
jgi:Cu+-exporting ATPase